MSERGRLLPWVALLLTLACGKESSDEGERSREAAQAACADYCDSVMSACTGHNAVYVSNASCLAVCALLEPGDPTEAAGNTLACRAHQANLAEAEPETYCAAAGLGGNDRCGSDCEAYCAVYSQACPDEAQAQGTDSCLEQCGGLVDQPGFDLIADHGGDTLECRLVHTASATLAPSDHCQHALIAPTDPWCVPER